MQWGFGCRDGEGALRELKGLDEGEEGGGGGWRAFGEKVF